MLEERVKGVSQIRIINRFEGSDHTIDFGEDIYTAWMSVNPEYDAEVIRLGYSSLTTPTTTFAYHVHERRFEVLKQQEIVEGMILLPTKAGVFMSWQPMAPRFLFLWYLKRYSTGWFCTLTA